MEFAGERILVTGAGKGIGRATAVRLAALGAEVVAVSRSADDLDALRAEISCETHAADLADAAATQALARRLQPIDRLVNNAGIAHLAPFLDTTVASFDAVMAVNVTAAMIFGQETARSLIARGRPGSIVNVSSVASSLGLPDHAAYCASKGALDSLTMVMARELGAHGIRVNAVNPTVVLTPMAVLAWSDPAKSEPLKARIPMGRFIEPDEIADTILYLLGNRASMVNGVMLPVDGGLLVSG